jgi:hypothetical protein
MINKIAEQWSKIEVGVQGGEGEAEDLRQLLRQMVGVRDVLKRMCEVSVTRTSLKSAVREALLPIIQEHRDELFPELVELRNRLAAGGNGLSGVLELETPPDHAATAPAFPEELRVRLEAFEARIRRIAEIEESLQCGIQELDGRLASGFDRVDARQEEVLTLVEQRQQEAISLIEARQGEALSLLEGRQGEALSSLEGRQRAALSELETRQNGRFEELRATLNRELESRFLRVEEKIEKVRGFLRELESSIPETAQRAAGEVEERLRSEVKQEIETMVERLAAKLGELQELLGRIQGLIPRQEVLEGLDRRLERLEGCFATVSEQVRNIDAVAPELDGLRVRFSGLREQIAGVAADLQGTGRGVEQVREAFSRRLDELHGLLEQGISRWESDQSQMQERLTALRDTLRDQLAAISSQVAATEGSFWGKLTGKKDAGVKLSGQEWEELSAKLEGIIGGLEGIIARKTRG